MRISYALLGYLLVVAIDSAAQELPHYALQRYNSENGLPQNSAKTVALDHHGYLWIATEMGLARFDGSRFRLYNKGNMPLLQSNRIGTVGLMDNGNIFCIDEDNVIYYLNEQQQLVPYNGRAGIDVIPKAETFFNLRELWKKNDPQMLGKFLHPHLPVASSFLPTTDSITGFLLINRHRIVYLRAQKMQWVDSVGDVPLPVGFRFVGDNHHFYYLNNQSRIVAIDTTGKKEAIMISGALQRELQGPQPKVITGLFQQGKKIYAVCGNYIWQLAATGTSTLSGYPMLDIRNMRDLNCYRYYPSLNMHVVGSLTRGLNLLRKESFQTQVLDSPGSNVFYAQAPLPNNGVFTHLGIFYPHLSSKELPMKGIYLKSMLKDRKGHYWINANGATYEMNDQLKVIRKIRSPYSSIQCFQQAPDGEIWVSSGHLGKIVHDSIVWKYRETSGFNTETFIPVDEHRFWLGGEQGIREWDDSKKLIKEITTFSGKDVRCFYKDKSNTLWVGTYGNGFYAYYRNRFIKMPTDRNSYLSTVHTFLEDDKGFLWITTNKGLFQVQLKDLYAYFQDSTQSPYYYYYDKADGFGSNEFNGGCNPAGIVLSDGRFSFPTMDGLVQFHPDSIQPLLPVSDIFIDEAWIDSTRINGWKKITLPASFGRLQINISSPYFGNPYNQQIEYNLKGLNDNWYALGEDNTIVFNKLEHGEYALQLRKKAGFGINNYITRQFSFTVRPGFFDTWIFKILLLAGIGLFVYLFIKWRYRFLIHQKERLEKEVSVRTKQQEQLIIHLESTVSALQQSREELYYNNKFKEKLALIITHDLQSPLRFLSVMCHQLHKKAIAFNYDAIKNNTDELKNTSGLIHEFVEEFGVWATAQQDNFRINSTLFLLEEVIDELSVFFKEMLLARGNILVTEIKGSVMITTDKQLMKIILRNIIDNANKHTKNGTIVIGFTRKGNKGDIWIRDSGKGMNEQELHKIQARISQVSKAERIDEGKKLGYQIIIDFVNRLGVGLSLDSVAGKGTTVIIEGVDCYELTTASV